MVRCTSCGKDCPRGSLFCLNCGNRLPADEEASIPQTAASQPGLPGAKHCGQCNAENPPEMNFCRQCGNRLEAAASSLSSPELGAQVARQQSASDATQVEAPRESAPLDSPGASTGVRCQHCGGQTPGGFRFCQLCGESIAAPIDDELNSLSPKPLETVENTGSVAQPVPVRAEPREWGALISVKRDGTDGERFSLRGDWVEVGQQDAGIGFADDPFMAWRHARVEWDKKVVRIVPLDTFNGVFQRLDKVVELEHGDTILVGREVVRFEVLKDDERDPAPLLYHGVSMFASPPRQPWARLLHIIPSGAVRDVRYISRDEYIIGREEGDWMLSDDAFLSRKHVILRRSGASATIEDLQSSNGTFVRLRGPRNARSGDHFRMGDQLLRVEVAPAG